MREQKGESGVERPTGRLRDGRRGGGRGRSENTLAAAVVFTSSCNGSDVLLSLLMAR